MSDRPSLQQLGLKHHTDKADTHVGYLDFYATFLEPIRDTVRSVLEIGVCRGESLRMWEEYFPAANIYGVDLFPTNCFDAGRIRCFCADQANRRQLLAAATPLAPFDLIVDDGGHYMEQQQASLAVLFPLVKPGGLYVVEDLHSCFYPEQFNPDRRPTTFGILVDQKAAVDAIGMMAKSDQPASIDFWTRTSCLTQSLTAVLRKKP